MDTNPHSYRLKPIAHTWIFLPGYHAPDLPTAMLVFMAAFHAPWICALLNIIFLTLYYDKIFILSLIALPLSTIAAIIFSSTRKSDEDLKFSKRPLWISLFGIFIMPGAMFGLYMVLFEIGFYLLQQNILTNIIWYAGLFPLLVAQFFGCVGAVWLAEILRVFSNRR